MTNTILLESAELDLKGLLARLSLGETITLTDEDGAPLALLVSLSSDLAVKFESDSDWMKKWDDLAKEIDEAWQGEQGAVETLIEMRR